MNIVPLQIVAPPPSGRNFPGSGSVQMTGAVSPADALGLFFEWHTSLSQTVAPLSTVLDFPATLTTGSHIITFTAKDVEGNMPADLKNVTRIGFAGGPPIAQAPCIVHVFFANMVQPSTANMVWSKGSDKLAAEAPPSWSAPAYQLVNQLQFHWTCTPDGLPAGRAGVDFIPAFDELQFRDVMKGDLAGTPQQVIYTGLLTAALDIGSYIFTLRVEDKTDNSIGHEVSRSVVVTA